MKKYKVFLNESRLIFKVGDWVQSKVPEAIYKIHNIKYKKDGDFWGYDVFKFSHTNGKLTKKTQWVQGERFIKIYEPSPPKYKLKSTIIFNVSGNKAVIKSIRFDYDALEFIYNIKHINPSLSGLDGKRAESELSEI